jgi:hypothetical protein
MFLFDSNILLLSLSLLYVHCQYLWFLLYSNFLQTTIVLSVIGSVVLVLVLMRLCYLNDGLLGSLLIPFVTAIFFTHRPPMIKKILQYVTHSILFPDIDLRYGTSDSTVYRCFPNPVSSSTRLNSHDFDSLYPQHVRFRPTVC